MSTVLIDAARAYIKRGWTPIALGPDAEGRPKRPQYQKEIARVPTVREKSVVLGRDRDVLPQLFALHAPEAKEILDCTYNRGVMWKGSGYCPTITSDTDETLEVTHVADCRHLWFAEDASLDVIVFDPPHLPAASASVGSSGIERKQYGLTEEGDYRQGDNIAPLFFDFLKESSRALRPDGVVFAKIADLVHNHRYQWQHVDFIRAAEAAGMTPCDVIIKADPSAANLKSSKWQRVHHFRRAHCYWIVVRNSLKCEPRTVA